MEEAGSLSGWSAGACSEESWDSLDWGGESIGGRDAEMGSSSANIVR